MTVFRISPLLFFFIGLSAAVCANIALYVVKASFSIRVSAPREALKWAFCVYLLLFAAFSFFPVQYEVVASGPVFSPAHVNLVPFLSIGRAFSVLTVPQFSPGFKLESIARGVLSDFFAFFPLGFLLPLVHKSFRRPATCVAFSLLLSLFVELVQFLESSFGLTADHATDIDNVLLGVAGAAAGYLALRALLVRLGLLAAEKADA